MTQLDHVIAADRAQTDIAFAALQARNAITLSRPEDRYPILSYRAADHYAGFDQVPVPDSLFDEMLGETDADAQAWVEERRR